MPRHERDTDGGFTLIELAVTVVIMTVVLGALTMGVVTLLRTTGVTTDRLVGSHDAQLLTEWITTDIQSAATAPNVTTTTPPGCADDASLPATGMNVAQMTWTDRSTGLVYHAAYRTEQINAGPPAVWYLVRYFCQQGQPSTHFPVVRGLSNGFVCPSGVPASEATCVLTATWPRFDLRIVSVANAQSYTFTATATGRTAMSGTDTTGPNFVSAVAYNTDSSGNAGPIDRVVVTFDEVLTPNDALLVTKWTLQNAPNGVTVMKAVAANHAVTLTLGNGAGLAVTSASNFKIDLQTGNGVQDGLGNQAPAFTGKTVADAMAPVIVSAKTGDSSTPPDQVVDEVTLTMSEPIDNNSLAPANTMFVVTPPPDPAWAGVVFNVVLATKTGATTVVLSLQSIGAPPPPDPTISGLTVAVIANPNGLRDPARHFGASTHMAGDGIPPEVLSIKSHASAAGKIDQIIVDFSESLQPSNDASLWHLSIPAGWVTPPTVSNVLVSGSRVTLTIDPTSVLATPDTAVPGLTATLDPSVTTGIRDSAGNPAAFTGTFVTDAMAPLLTSVAFTGGATPGLFETGDILTATFSEPLASVTTTPTVTLDQPVGAATATLDIPGLTAGAIDTLSGAYFVTDGNRAQWPASVVQLGNKITVTLTGPCAGSVADPTCANLRAGTFVNTPLGLAATIVDRVVPHNAALDTTLNIRWF